MSTLQRCILLAAAFTTAVWAQVGYGITTGQTARQSKPAAALGLSIRCTLHSSAEAVQRILTQLPARPGGKGPTDGVLEGPDGTRLPIKSGYEGPRQPGTGRRLPSGRDLPRLPGLDRYRRSHVEAHAAAVIRGNRWTKATLYLNNVPCERPYTRTVKGGRVCTWLGCLVYLEDWLPKGYELVVFVKDVTCCMLFRGRA
jgi:hypothetical protein